MKTTRYFEEVVRVRHPEARRDDWIEAVLTAPNASEVEPNGRLRYWAYIVEAGRWLRVVLEPDGETVHNSFFDDPFGRRRARGE